MFYNFFFRISRLDKANFMSITYEKAGVSIKKEEKSIKKITDLIKGTYKFRANKIGEYVPTPGHYANLVEVNGRLFGLCTDGVGTKVLIAQMMDSYASTAIDMIAMNVNDMICVGAEPLALVNYFAFESYNEKISSEVAKGLYEGSKQANIAIIGGETATLKGVITGYKGRGYDIAGTCLGVVDKDRLVMGDKIKKGDAIIGIQSSGIHSNGLTFARKVFLEKNSVHDVLFDKKPIGEILLTPTIIYVKPIMKIIKNNFEDIHGLFHITGSGFLNLTRLNKEVGFEIQRLLPIPRVFDEIQRRGQVSDEEMFRTFNMGVGFVVVASQPEQILKIIRRYGLKADVIGVVTGNKCKVEIKEKGIILG